MKLAAFGIILLLVLLVLLPLFVWFGCRIEPGMGRDPDQPQAAEGCPS